MTARTLALVESATQLINAAEWVHASGEVDTTDIAVLPPTDAESVRQIEGVVTAVRASGVSVAIRPVRAAGPGMPFVAARVMAEVRRAPTLVIGDAFSRYIHALLPLSRASHVVVVDDGTATWDFAARIDAGEPLVRWTKPASDARAHAARATRLLSPTSHRSIDVFTCLSDATPVGAMALANRYRWIRSRHVPVVVDDHVDLLGTSLVGSGVVERHAYLNAIAAMARRNHPIRYIAHRRESENLVAEIATIPNLRVVRPSQPVEMLLRGGPVARQVIAFPSTAAHTLPLVVQDLDVHIAVQPIQQSWFTPQATLRARSFVARIAADAPVKAHIRL